MPIYNVENFVLGSYHQGHAKFGQTAGRQCACNALFSIFWSRIRNIVNWIKQDLDMILLEGDNIYKSLNTENYLSVDDLPRFIDIGGLVTDINYSDLITSEATLVPNFPFLRVVFGNLSYSTPCLMFINGYTVALFKSQFDDACYLFDSHSRDERGLSVHDGKSVLLKFSNLSELEAYVQVLYLEYQSKETTYFQLQFIDMNPIDDELRSNLIQIFRNFLRCHLEVNNESDREKRRERSKLYYKDVKQISKENYQKNKEKSRQKYQENKENLKKKSRENYQKNKEKSRERYQQNKENLKKKSRERYQQNKESLKEKSKENYQKNKEKSRERYQQNKENLKRKYKECNREKAKENYQNKKKNTEEHKADLFKDHVKQGPYHICVCCNRCLYRHSVKKFAAAKYPFNVEGNCNMVSSFDGLFYICKTCDSKLSKKQIPCQSVSNKLEIFEFPEEIRNMRRLEKVLVAMRIIFKKITVMQKGNFPKVKGTLCNVPIESTNNLLNILPRPADSNGVILVKLKRKLEYRGHVYFESVRPEYIFKVLQYLRVNNHFYRDIEINTDNIPDELINLADNNEMQRIDDNSVITENLLKDIHLPINIDLVQCDDDELETAEDPLNAYRITANETVLMSHVPTEVEIDNEILNIAPGEGVSPINILNDKNCEELAHPDLFPTGQFGYKVERKIPLSPSKYFNQRLLNYTQKFASDSDYIFFVNFVLQQLQLTSQINIAMKKVAAESLTAGMLSQNFKDTVRQFIANDKAFSFMNSVKGTPAYWKKFLQEVLAMVKQLGPPTFFLTLSCADLRWNELVSIIYKLKGETISEHEINSMPYQERCNLLNSNPVLLARHFQYRVETFFKDIIIDGPLGKVQYYAIRVEFQVRGSPHIHAFLWTKDNILLTEENKDVYVDYIDSKISAELPNASDRELFNLVKTYQIHRHSKTCRKYRNKQCRFDFGKYFTNRTLIAVPLPITMDPTEKSRILEFRKQILEPVRTYINQHLNPRSVNFYDKDAESYVELPSIEVILASLNISKDDYYKALAISDDDDFQIHLRRMPDSCFVNNYFPTGLSAWEANIDIQPVHNHYKAVTYMCAYLSKAEDECSHAMTQAAKEAYENNDDTYTKMKSIAKAYTTRREVSVQEAVYLVLPELWLRKVFPGVLFVCSNVPEKRYRMCLSEKEILELPKDSTAIYKKNMLDRYVDRPNRNFSNGKYFMLDEFCLAEFLRYYTVKYDVNKDNDCQPNELPDDIVECNHQTINYPKVIPLMSSPEKLKCRNVPLVLRYYEPNRNKNPEEYAHHLLFMFYPFRNEEELLSENGSYVEMFSVPRVIDIVNENRQIIEPYSNIVQQAYEQFLYDQVNAPYDSFGQQENDDTQVDHVSNDTEETVNNIADVSAGISIASLVLSDSDINSRIRSLNKQQRNVFNFVIQWARDFMKNLNCKVTTPIHPFNLFLTGGGGVGKSHLLTTIYHTVTKILLHLNREPNKQRVLILAPTGVAAINIAGTTIHSGLTIPTHGKLFPLNDKAKASLRQKLSSVELIIIDEISMVSSRLFRDVDLRLREIFLCDKPFGGKSVILCGDLYQLPPVQGKPVYVHDTSYMQGLLGFELWKSFSMAELTEIMRQKGDSQFIDLLNQCRTGTLDEENIKLLKSRFIDKNAPTYPVETIHIFAENKPVYLHNNSMLQTLDTPLFKIQAIDEYPTESELSNTDVRWVQTAKPSETGGLAFEINLKVNARVMITKNIDIEDKLINGQVGCIQHIKCNNNKVTAIYVKIDDETAGVKSRQSDHLARSNNWVKIERVESVFNIKKRFSNSPSIRRIQFPLMLAWACTVHKVQGLSLPSAVISFELSKQKQFNAGQMYVALSRVKSLEGLHLVGKYSMNAIKVNKKAEIEYQRLQEQSLFEPVKTLTNSSSTLTIALLNTRSLSKHSGDIASDTRLCNVDILCLTETQLLLEHDVSSIDNSLVDYFVIDYNTCSAHKYNNLAICYKNTVSIGTNIKSNAVSIITFKKPSFSSQNITLALIYRQQNLSKQIFFNNLSGLLNDYAIDIITGDFNIDALDETSHLPVDELDDYRLIVNHPTHLSGSLLDHVYIKKTLLAKNDCQVCIENVFFSDHDVVTFQLSNI